jgi:hypothetical protein
MANRTDDEFEPEHTASSTAEAMEFMALQGYRPAYDEEDARPIPDEAEMQGAIAEMFDGLSATLQDTRLAPDLSDLLWGAVNLFHRGIDRVQRKLDENEDAQKASQKLQDGSEIRSVEIERLIADGQTLLDRRDGMEQMRDLAAERYEQILGTAWRPFAGSMVNHRAMTAAMIDSRDFVRAKRRAETEVMIPAGTLIAFSGGIDFDNHRLIWDVLDKVKAKYPDMVLLHTANIRGADVIAVGWAGSRKVAAIGFKPERRFGNAAPFKRNDAILREKVRGAVICDGTGIQEQLAREVRRLHGIEPLRLKRGGA